MSAQKTCPYCREAIHGEARKCPHCGQWLGKAMAMIYIPSVIFLAIALYVMVGSLSFFPGRSDPAVLVRHMSIVESSFRFNTAGDSTHVSAVGTIRNDSEDVAVDDIYIEVQYFDAEGSMIDAEGAEQYGLVLLPGSEAAFRLHAHASAPESEYASHEVFIRSAREARDLF